ncbi:MAG: LysM peptidoglycan-binding domain-containing protein [Paludibacteraceae bacterium]
MKNKFLRLLLFIFFCTTQFVDAQQPNYPIKTIDGIEYYIYTVEAGEGLYAISRRFGVTQADINNVNPQIHDGLKSGTEILIPKKDEKISSNSVVLAENVEFVLHTVQRRQTMFAISRKYNVTQDAIIKSNPQIQNRGIQPGDVLRIPVVKKTTPPTTKTKATNNKPATSRTGNEDTRQTLHIGADNTYITHQVVSGETLSSIGRKYNVSVNELKRLNPESADELPIGVVLKVPFPSNNSNTATPAILTQSKPNATSPAKPNLTLKTKYKIAYLLPFLAEEKNDPTADKFIEFYMGSLLAINNAKNSDLEFEILAFDTEKTETKLFEIINKPELQKVDLIIGPAYTAQIPILVDFAKRRKIHAIIPFSSKAKYMDDNPYLFQFNPDQAIQNDFAVDLFTNNFKHSNIILVETGNTNWSDDGTDYFTSLKQQFDRQKINYNFVKNAQLNVDWNIYLASNKNNIIIFDAEDFKPVSSYMSVLYDFGAKYDIAVLGQYSWRGQTGKKPKMYYMVPFAGNKFGTQFYEQEFKKYYKNIMPITNPRYDLLGYDITTYFLSTMRRTGFTFNSTTQVLNFTNGVQSDFEFKRTNRNGGFVNHKLYLIKDEATSK